MKKYVFITGASSGFGEACAHIFAKNGFSLVLVARRKDKLEQLKVKLQNTKVSIHYVELDIRIEKDVINVISTIPEEIKNKIHILINNAGLAVGRSSIENALTDDWERMIDTNIKGLLYVSKAIIPFLKLHQSSQIINISSIAGKEVYPGGNVYCATKHAVDALSKAMRMDLVSHGIKVTNIAPGAAETEFSLVRFKGDQEAAKSIYKGFDALQANDVAEAIWFVTSRPVHVTINDLTIMPTAQASASILHKK
jgi:3-hydroxy acid dehydrogenase / malonic semialdehyde reductase